MAYYGYSKYKAKKTVVDGITFDSKKEASRYGVLKGLEENGFISDLELQRKFPLIPKQLNSDGKVGERECSYIADFCYKDSSGAFIVEDTKGMRTPEYIIKRKLMRYKYGIIIHEV